MLSPQTIEMRVLYNGKENLAVDTDNKLTNDSTKVRLFNSKDEADLTRAYMDLSDDYEIYPITITYEIG